MTMKKKLRVLALAGALALTLSGCSAVRYLLTGDWNGDADLVVVSQSSQVVYTLDLCQESWRGSTAGPDGRGLLERGESYALTPEETGPFTLELLGEGGELLGRWTGEFDGERLYLTLWEDGAVTASKEG